MRPLTLRLLLRISRCMLLQLRIRLLGIALLRVGRLVIRLPDLLLRILGCIGRLLLDGPIHRLQP